jgi:hypothetical protein
LLVAIVEAGINFYLTMRQRETGLAVAKRPEVALDPDYYVVPRRQAPVAFFAETAL